MISAGGKIFYNSEIGVIGVDMGEIVIHIDHEGPVTIIEMAGELDSLSASDAQDQILPRIERNCKILLEMSGVKYMSSAGLRILLLLYRRIQDNTGDVVIAGLGDEVREVMEITGFLDFFKTVDQRNDGVRLLNR